MVLFDKRNDYTLSPAIWPVIPTTLSRDLVILECLDMRYVENVKICAPGGMVLDSNKKEGVYILKSSLSLLKSYPHDEPHIIDKLLSQAKHKRTFTFSSKQFLGDLPFGIQEYIIEMVAQGSKLSDDIKEYFLNLIEFALDDGNNEKDKRKMSGNTRSALGRIKKSLQNGEIKNKYIFSHIMLAVIKEEFNQSGKPGLSIPNELLEFIELDNDLKDVAKECKFPRIYMPYDWNMVIDINEKSELLYYGAGLHDTYIRGWGTAIAERDIKHPTLMWQKVICDIEKINDIEAQNSENNDPKKRMWWPSSKSIDKSQMLLAIKKIESDLHWTGFSPVCSTVRQHLEKADYTTYCKFCDKCGCQDVKIIEYLWDMLDTHRKNVFIENVFPNNKKEAVFKLSIGNEEITIYANRICNNHTHDDVGDLFFIYECQVIKGITEIVYPIWYEGVIVALVMVGQIVKDDNASICENVRALLTRYNIGEDKKEALISDITSKLDNYRETVENVLKNKESKDIVCFIINQMRKHSNDLLSVYQQQIDGERRRIVQIAINNYLNCRNDLDVPKGSNKKDTEPGENIDKIRKDNIHDYYTACLAITRRLFGIKACYLFLDENLVPDFDTKHEETGLLIINDLKKGGAVDGKWYERLDINNKDNRLLRKLFACMKEESKIGNPFRQSENLDKWTCFIHAPNGRETTPVIVTIEYHSAGDDQLKSNRNDYHNAKNNQSEKNNLQPILWEEFVLRTFTTHFHNTLDVYDTRKSEDLLLEHSSILEHEVGNIYVGTRALQNSLSSKIEKITNSRSDNAKSSLDYLIESVNQFIGDVDGNFGLVKTLSSFTDYINPVADWFDVSHEFLNRWSKTFSSSLRGEGKRLKIDGNVYVYGISPDEKKSFKKEDRMMYTSPSLLETMLYNIMLNAIKYSYPFTLVTLKCEKDAVNNTHIFTITDYGDEIKEDEKERIFDKSFRGSVAQEAKAIHNLNADKDGGAGESGRKLEGKGIGLYWSKQIAKLLNCTIELDCEKVTDYNVSMIQPLVNRYMDDNGLFGRFWDEMVKAEEKIEVVFDIDKKKNEFEAPIKKVNEIINETDWYNIMNLDDNDSLLQEKINSIYIGTIFENIMIPTYKVTFKITVPYLKNEGE